MGPSHAVLAAILAAAGMLHSSTPASSVDARRARSAFAAMQRTYLDRRTGDYRELPGGPVSSRAWPFSQALAATVAVAAMPDSDPVASRAVPTELVTLDSRFRSGDLYAAEPGGFVYYDDDEWIALDLLSWDGFHADPAARRAAKHVLAAIVSAWDADTAAACPGGVPWTTDPANGDRNTVSTANGAILALRLYALTRRHVYLTWATRMLRWVDGCLLESDGLYGDHVGADGTIDETEWSYNQGSMLDAYRLLYDATGDTAYLDRAEAIADPTLAAFAGRWATSEPPEFAAIFFRRLLLLAGDAGRSDYVADAQAYADELWSAPRRNLLAQAALVQVYAALAVTPGA